METLLPQGKKIKYCLYARKSSERDELQALSIDSQVNEMLGIAEREGLDVVEIKKESHSAKDSGERPIFNELIKAIKADKFQGLLSYDPSRISRCAGDLGTIVDLMDQKYLLEIRTCNQLFSNNPNDKFLLMILGSQAKFENDHKAISVKRGLKAKCEMGYRPGMAPMGYMHDKHALKGAKKVLLDPVRAPLIKEMFEKVAYEGYTGRSIQIWLNNAGFTSRGGNRVSFSSIYEMLKNTYYYGEFEYPEGSGNWYKVAHESIINKELFDEVQVRIAVAPKVKYGIKEFEFTRLIKCGYCGSGICAEDKFKKLKNGSLKRYVYYHCSKGADRDCRQPYINEDDLIQQLLQVITEIPLDRLKTQIKLKEEFDRYHKFTEKVLQNESDIIKLPKVDLRRFAEYILKEGSRDDKRELLSCLNTKIYLKDKQIYLEK